MAKVFTTDNFETEVLKARKAGTGRFWQPGADHADVRLRSWKSLQKPDMRLARLT